MLPQQTLSTTVIPGQYIGAQKLLTSPRLSYEDGGVALNDPSKGFNYQVWRCRLVGDDFIMDAREVPPTTVFSAAGVTDISHSFDQNMQPALAYVQDGVGKLRWYDATIPGYDIITLGSSIKTPKLLLDDKRATQSLNKDIILGYINGTSLCYRQQRDRFLVEYVLQTNVAGEIYRMGMNDKLRLQFTLGTPYT